MPRRASQQMITFWFRNGATAAIRNSGTEAKLKFYVKTRHDEDLDKAKALLDKITAALLDKMTAALLKHFMQMAIVHSSL